MADSESDFLRPGQTIRPKADKKTASDLVTRLYGFRVKNVTELNAYDDKNFHVTCDERDFDNPWINEVSGDGYVLKIMNSLDSKKTDFVDGQNELLIFLNENEINSPSPVRNLQNRFYSLEKIGDGSEKHVVRLLTYRPGKILNSIDISVDLLLDVGRFTANLDQTLKRFHHPAYDEYKTLWMLSSVPRLRDFVYAVENAERRFIVENVIARFEGEVIENMDNLETGMIHGDLNEQNIIVDDKGKKVSAVLDLGDSQKSCLIFELAIALCYMIIKAKSIENGKHLLRGYEGVRKLPNFEKKILKTCVCARLCQSLVMSAYSHLNDPQNEYILSTQKNGWIILEELWPLGDDEILQIWELTSD